MKIIWTTGSINNDKTQNIEIMKMISHKYNLTSENNTQNKLILNVTEFMPHAKEVVSK